jgi:hypothetical protein
VAIPRPSGRKAGRGAALAVLAARDDGQGKHAASAAAIERLRQTLTKPATARPMSGPRPPRTGTKQAPASGMRPPPAGWAGQTTRRASPTRRAG